MPPVAEDQIWARKNRTHNPMTGANRVQVIEVRPDDRGADYTAIRFANLNDRLMGDADREPQMKTSLTSFLAEYRPTH